MEKSLKSAQDEKKIDVRCPSRYAHKLAEIVDDRYFEIICKSCGLKKIIDMEEHNKN